MSSCREFQPDVDSRVCYVCGHSQHEHKRGEGERIMSAHSAHTPGPWQFKNVPFVHVEGQMNIDDFTGHPHPASSVITEAMANARLIAAAPELLGACNAIDEWMRDDSSDLTWRRKVIFDMRAAIAQATESGKENAS